MGSYRKRPFLPCESPKTDFSGSLNRTVYASPPLGGSGSVLARSIAPQLRWGTLIPTPKLRHILFALQMLRICLFGLAKRRKQPDVIRHLDKGIENVVDKIKNVLYKSE
jgi:hypothetical protein